MQNRLDDPNLNILAEIEALQRKLDRLESLEYGGGIGAMTIPVLIRDIKANGVAAQSTVTAAWETRELTTIVADPSGLASLASNQIELAAGVYLGYIAATHYRMSESQLRLYNISDSAELVLSQNAYTSPALDIQGIMSGWGYFTLAAAKTLELQYYCSSAAGGTVGILTTSGADEVYAEVMLLKLG